jgi:HAMP domain-containing protein
MSYRHKAARALLALNVANCACRWAAESWRKRRISGIEERRRDNRGMVINALETPRVFIEHQHHEKCRGAHQ